MERWQSRRCRCRRWCRRRRWRRRRRGRLCSGGGGGCGGRRGGVAAIRCKHNLIIVWRRHRCAFRGGIGKPLLPTRSPLAAPGSFSFALRPLLALVTRFGAVCLAALGPFRGFARLCRLRSRLQPRFLSGSHGSLVLLGSGNAAHGWGDARACSRKVKIVHTCRVLGPKLILART